MTERAVVVEDESPALAFQLLARQDPERAAVAVGRRTWTRAEIAGCASRMASRLARLGVGHGDRVAVVRRNCVLHLITALASAHLGAVLVPLNFRLSASEWVRILQDARPSAVLCGARQARELEPHRGCLPSAVWVIDDMDPTGEVDAAEPPAPWRRLSALDGAGAGREIPDPVRVRRDDLWLIQYTSGSTGRAKGVRMSYGSIWASWHNLGDSLPVSAFEVTLAAAPFGHVGGLNTFCLQSLVAGGEVVVLHQFDVGLALELIATHRVRSLFGVPTMYEAMWRHPVFADADLSTLTAAIIGGAAPAPELLEAYAERGVPLYHSWGMTETMGCGTLLAPVDRPARPSSVGRIVPGFSARLVDGGHHDVARSETGELCLRGAAVTPGYWGADPTPASDFLPGGWLLTGDLASIDDDGFVFIRGRVKELIISGGENIYPAEIECLILEHPAVQDAAVVGVPDSRWGETPMACVVPRPGVRPPDLDELRAFLGGRLARYKLPRHLTVLGELPLAASGKVDRALLASRGRAEHRPGAPWYHDPTPQAQALSGRSPQSRDGLAG